MKTTKYNVTCGIYATEAFVRDYGDKICVTVPYVNWTNNTGYLDFYKQTIKDEKTKEKIRKFTNQEITNTYDGESIWDYI